MGDLTKYRMRNWIDACKEPLTESKKSSDGEDPCWKGYAQYGMKKKGKKEVPNCVPVEEEAPTRAARTSSEPKFTEADLRAAHREGYAYAKKQAPSYKGGYHASFWDHSPLRKKLGLGPKRD